MNEYGKRKGHDVIERYCSHVGDNVIMVRNHGAEDKYTCLSSQLCGGSHGGSCSKDRKFEPNCAYMPTGTGLYTPKDDGPLYETT